MHRLRKGCAQAVHNMFSLLRGCTKACKTCLACVETAPRLSTVCEAFLYRFAQAVHRLCTGCAQALHRLCATCLSCSEAVQMPGIASPASVEALRSLGTAFVVLARPSTGCAQALHRLCTGCAQHVSLFRGCAKAWQNVSSLCRGYARAEHSLVSFSIPL